MSFYANNDSIKITDASGNTVFDTDRKMPAITNILEGTIIVPARGRTTSQTNILHTISSVDSENNFVLSACKVTGGSSYPWRDTVFNASGSTITNLGWQIISGSWRLGASRTINFEVNGNTLQLREQYYNLFNTVSLASFTLNYKIYLGRYE